MLLCFTDVSWVEGNNKRKQNKQAHLLLFRRLHCSQKKNLNALGVHFPPFHKVALQQEKK
jgi:hypothetical protein